jgi:hypothetical protein
LSFQSHDLLWSARQRDHEGLTSATQDELPQRGRDRQPHVARRYIPDNEPLKRQHWRTQSGYQALDGRLFLFFVEQQLPQAVELVEPVVCKELVVLVAQV